MLTMILRFYRANGTEIDELRQDVNDLFDCSCELSMMLNKIQIGELEIHSKIKKIAVFLSEDMDGNPHVPEIRVYEKALN